MSSQVPTIIRVEIATRLRELGIVVTVMGDARFQLYSFPAGSSATRVSLLREEVFGGEAGAVRAWEWWREEWRNRG